MRVRPDLAARSPRQPRYSDIAFTLRLRLREPRQRGAVMAYATVGWRKYVPGATIGAARIGTSGVASGMNCAAPCLGTRRRAPDPGTNWRPR